MKRGKKEEIVYGRGSAVVSLRGEVYGRGEGRGDAIFPASSVC